MLGKINVSDWPNEVSESLSCTVAPGLNFFFGRWPCAEEAKRHEMSTIERKRRRFTGWEKIAITTGIHKVQINLIDKQRFGTPIEHIDRRS